MDDGKLIYDDPPKKPVRLIFDAILGALIVLVLLSIYTYLGG